MRDITGPVTLTRRRYPLFSFSSDERECHIKLHARTRQFSAAWLPDIHKYILDQNAFKKRKQNKKKKLPVVPFPLSSTKKSLCDMAGWLVELSLSIQFGERMTFMLHKNLSSRAFARYTGLPSNKVAGKWYKLEFSLAALSARQRQNVDLLFTVLNGVLCHQLSKSQNSNELHSNTALWTVRVTFTWTNLTDLLTLSPSRKQGPG